MITLHNRKILAAQRFALPALGRAWIRFESRKKTEASLSWPTGQGKMLENGAESHQSGARFVGKPFDCKTLLPF